LHGQAIVSLRIEKIVSWHGSVAEIVGATARIVNRVRTPSQQVSYHLRPNWFSFSDDNRICVTPRLAWKSRYVQSAEHNLSSERAVPVRKNISVLHLRRETGNRYGIKFGRHVST
jgi:hypothetical protein